jgi:hypothetical protein
MGYIFNIKNTRIFQNFPMLSNRIIFLKKCFNCQKAIMVLKALYIYIYIDQELIFLTHIAIKTKRLTIIKIGGGLTH